MELFSIPSGRCLPLIMEIKLINGVFKIFLIKSIITFIKRDFFFFSNHQRALVSYTIFEYFTRYSSRLDFEYIPNFEYRTFWQKPSLSTYCAYFFRQKPSRALCLIFLKKKASCAYSAKWITLNFLAKAFVLAKLCLWCAYFFRQKPSCAMCLIFSTKKPLCA